MTQLRFVKTPEQLIEAAENNLEFFDANMQAIKAWYKTEPGLIEQLIPAPLEPHANPMVRIVISRVFVDLNGGMDFGAATFGVNCMYKGKEGIYEGKKVWLDVPMEEVILYEAKYNGREVSLNSPKKKGSQNYVYVTGCLKDKSEVKKITYGSAMKDKLKDADRRNAFAARHGCEGLSLKDKCTKKYWACRKPKDFASVNAWW